MQMQRMDGYLNAVLSFGEVRPGHGCLGGRPGPIRHLKDFVHKDLLVPFWPRLKWESNNDKSSCARGAWTWPRHWAERERRKTKESGTLFDRLWYIFCLPPHPEYCLIKLVHSQVTHVSLFLWVKWVDWCINSGRPYFLPLIFYTSAVPSSFLQSATLSIYRNISVYALPADSEYN